MKTEIVRVVAAVVDKENLILYRPDGSQIKIPQGDARVRKIVDYATPLLIARGWVDVDLAKEEENAYADFEENTGGMVRFFRVAKHRLAKLLTGTKEEMAENVPAQQIGTVPSKADSMKNAVNEILANATPAKDVNFHEHGLNTQAPIVDHNGKTPKAHTKMDSLDTIVAVVGNTVVPGVEKIRNQFSRATKLGSTVGVENFLKRLGSIIEKRSHSVEDLLKFMERGDLPIAEDGSILVYKVLRRLKKEDDPRVQYVDCHTKTVPQWVGAYVCMDSKLVDHNRSNECSNGLHIARRGYISEFSGDVCVLAKLAPEDVITVPSYDANKMRACGYHIIAELSNDQYRLLQKNKPITEREDGQILLAQAMAGQHIGRTHEVRIVEQPAKEVVITDLIPAPKVPPKPKPVAPVEALADNPEIPDDPIDPMDVAKTVHQLSRKEVAIKLSAEYHVSPTQEGYDAIMAHKRSSKVSWEKLGIVEPARFPVLKIESFPAEKPAGKAPARPVVKRTATTKAKVAPKATKARKPAVVEALKAKPVEGITGSFRDRVQALLPVTTKEAAQKILDLKRQSKKS